jgi:hypothetical protein
VEQLVNVKLIVGVLALLSSVNAYAATAWEHLSSGDGTAFEERWVANTAILSMSSDETLASDMPLAAKLWKGTGLFIFVSHTSSEICEFSDWKLAVDRTLISVNSKLAEGTKQTGLFPSDDAEAEKLLKLFGEGEKIAVRFHANCDNMFYLKFVGPVTLTYSLEGSSAALSFLRGGSLENAEDEERHFTARNSAEMAAYQFAIAQKIRRNWAVPASAGPDTKCSVRVTQLPGGEVVGVSIISCNGDEAVRRSVEAAIMRSSPLPDPSNPDLFHPELTLNLALER